MEASSVTLLHAKVAAQTDRIRDLVASPVIISAPETPEDTQPTIKRPAIDVLLRRAEALIVADLTGQFIPDGYSATTPGNGNPGGGLGGGPTIAVADGDGGLDVLPTNPTEAAAFANLATGHRASTTSCTPKRWRCATRSNTLERALVDVVNIADRHDRFRDTSTVPEPPMCWLAKHYELRGI